MLMGRRKAGLPHVDHVDGETEGDACGLPMQHHTLFPRVSAPHADRHPLASPRGRVSSDPSMPAGPGGQSRPGSYGCQATKMPQDVGATGQGRVAGKVGGLGGMAAMAGRPLAHGFDGLSMGPRTGGTWLHRGLLRRLPGGMVVMRAAVRLTASHDHTCTRTHNTAWRPAPSVILLRKMLESCDNGARRDKTMGTGSGIIRSGHAGPTW